MDVPVDVLCERLQRRAMQKGEASEADLAVLEFQLEHEQPIAADEMQRAVRVGAEPPDTETLVEQIRACVNGTGRSSADQARR